MRYIKFQRATIIMIPKNSIFVMLKIDPFLRHCHIIIGISKMAIFHQRVLVRGYVLSLPAVGPILP